MIADGVRLPPAARHYVDAVNGGDLDALVASFQPDGEVIDVGRRIVGAAAIRSWAEDDVIGGRLEVMDTRATAAGVVLLVRFSPQGTGEGFEANYDFRTEGDRIRRATLTYA